MFKRLLTTGIFLFSVSLESFAVDVGATPPAFSLPALKNATVDNISLDAYKGKVVYVDFWASWCGPCRQSLPILNDIRAKYHAKGFEVIAINIDENKADAMGFLAKYPVDYPIAADPKSKTPEMYKIKGMPTAYIIDRKGKVRHVHEGFKKSDASEIEFMIQEYLAEK